MRRLFILALLSVHGFFPGSLCAAAPTLAVVPVLDGSSDDESRDLALAFDEALQRLDFETIAPQRIVDVVQSSSTTVLEEPEAVAACRQQFAAATAAYLRFENREGEQYAAAIVEQFQGHPAWHALYGALHFDALLLLALIHQSENDLPAMQAALEQAATVAPLYTLPADRYPPSIIQGWQVAQAQRRRTSVGDLQVTSAPPAAEVRLGGVAIGMTPLTVRDLPAGTYPVALVAPSYAPITRSVTVRPGKEARWHARLRWSEVQRAASSTHARSGVARAQEGYALAERLRADGVIFVDVDERHSRGEIRVQFVDAVEHVMLRPLAIPLTKDRTQLAGALSQLTQRLSKDVRREGPVALAALEMTGTERVSALTRERRRVSPWVWTAGSLLLGGGVLAGVLLTGGGGGAGLGALLVTLH